MITKTDFDAKLSGLIRKITKNKSKHLLVENELNKLKTFDSSYFHGKNYFDEDGTHNYIFQPISKYLKVAYVNDINYILFFVIFFLCDKNCDIGEYLDYENCKCRKKLADKLIDECTETIKEIKLANINFTGNENNYEHNSCKVYILMIIAFTIITRITVYLVHCNWYLIKNNIFCIKFNTGKNTEIC